MGKEKGDLGSLPVNGDLSLIIRASMIVVLFVSVASVSGLIITEKVYPSEELVQSFLANDVVNLLVGLPVLLLSLWLTRRGKLIGLLFLPGALFYMVYNYLIYLVAMPFSVFYVMFLVVVVLSLVLMIWLLKQMDGKLIKDQLDGDVPVRFAGGVMIGFGVLFVVRVFALIGNGITSDAVISMTEVGLNVADVLISLVLIICGLQLWRRKVIGFLTGLGLLFQASMLFVALIVLMLIQPVLTGGPILWFDIIVVFLMGFIAFVPMIMFIQGVRSIDRN